MEPRKHKALIIAWANGAEIEYRQGENWYPTKNPWWEENVEYRIKPEPKPDIVKYVCITQHGGGLISIERHSSDNLCLTFDAETGKLKSAEVLHG